MAKAKCVQAQVVGGKLLSRLEVETVQEAHKELNLSGNYTASVNGEPAEMSTKLKDGDFVSFATAVKGGFQN